MTARGTHEQWAIDGVADDRLTLDLHIPPDPRRVIVMAHGVDNSRQARYITVARRVWNASGSVIAAIDAPFHGERSGLPRPEPVGTSVALLEQWVGDHRRAIDAIDERFPGYSIGFVGFSMGGLFAVPLVTQEPRIGALVVAIAGSTSVSYPRRFSSEVIPDLEATDPATFAPEVAVPTLLINTFDDELVPPSSAVALLRAFAGPRRMLLYPGSHEVWDGAARWYREMDAFFVEWLGTRSDTEVASTESPDG